MSKKAICENCKYYSNGDGRYPENGYCDLYGKDVNGEDAACSLGARSGYMSDFDDSRF